MAQTETDPDAGPLARVVAQQGRQNRFLRGLTVVLTVTLIVVAFLAYQLYAENHKLTNLARENHRGMEAIVQATGPDATARSNTILGYFSSQLSALCVEVHAACPAPPPVLTTPPEAKR